MPSSMRGGFLRDDTTGALVVTDGVSQRLTSGEEVLPRLTVASSAALADGTMRLSYFTARKTEAITQMRMGSGNTAAGATPTLARFGVYSEDATTGDLTLLAAIASDTALFAATSTQYTRTLTSTFNKVAGTRYAVGVLMKSGAAFPSIAGVVTTSSSDAALAPRLSAALTGQTDLPATVTAASLVVSTLIPQAIFLP